MGAYHAKLEALGAQPGAWSCWRWRPNAWIENAAGSSARSR